MLLPYQRTAFYRWYLPVKKVYDYEPIDPKLTPEQGKYILGAQANLWTEYIASPAHAQYMLLPRLAALAEVQWTAPEKKNFPNFLKRFGEPAKLLSVKRLSLRQTHNGSYPCNPTSCQ